MNKIVDENAITAGRASKSYWDAGHSNRIEGFATQMSVDAGAQVDFKINVNDNAGSDYKVEIFRLGYYGGDGAREVAQWTNTNASVQPEALYDATRGLVDAGNWSVTDSWQVPESAVSGVYLARLQRLDASGNPIGGATNQIPFIIRNDGEKHDIVLQTSDTTWHAYNGWGGNNGQVGPNLYGDPSGRVNWDRIDGAGSYNEDRAYAVSYNRPIITDTGQSSASGPQDYLFGADYAAIYWLEKNGYDVSYISGVDTDRLGANYLKNYKAFISVGHDEYWSGGQRANVEAARDSGVNLLFWSGNECYWKTRWDTAISADGTEYRTLVCYKETVAVANPNAGPADYYNLDPSDIWTGTWRDTRFHGNPLAGGGNPQDVDPITGLCPYCHCGENALTGQLFGPDGTGMFGGALDVPAEFAGLRVWRDTTVANGGKLDIAPGILGYEWDTSPDNLQRPAGLIKLSGTTIPWDGILIDQGNTVSPGIATHNLSLYRAESGALVFGAGTTFWSWGLSDMHDSSPYGAQIESKDLQQLTLNIFADMGIQPGVSDAFLISQGLKRASTSNDHVAATAAFASPPNHVAALAPVTITGTATDNDGNPATADGHVAAVEVSTDGGSTWRVASTTDGWAHWSYTWQPASPGNYTLLARAIDDSLNIVSIVADRTTVTVTAPETYSLFNGTAPKSDTATLFNDNTAVELGMRFSVDRAGAATELKYWRSSLDADDTDVRQGHLWKADGTLIGTVTFTSPVGDAGWQTATLSTPVTLQPGVEYIVSYHTSGNYIASSGFFDASREVVFDGLDNDSFWGPYGVVRSPQTGAGSGNGVYGYGTGMPTSSWQGSNYWVDVTFDPTDVTSNRPPAITSPSAFSSPENRATVGTVTAADPDGNAVTFAISGGVDAARFSINAQTGVLSFVNTPNFELPLDANGDNVYQVTVSASDGIAAAVTQTISVSVTDVDETGLSSHVFADGAAPTVVETGDSTDYELGTRFQASAGGYVSELRYFRGAADAGDTDTRTLSLWTAAGERIGQVIVTSGAGETGWQVGTLTNPIAIQANTTYVVSYGTTDNYAYTSGWFATSHPSSDGVLAGANGVFGVGPGSFPTTTYNSTNYWVDVTFRQPDVANNHAPAITSPSAFASPENRATVGTVTAADPDGNPVTFAISGGADASRFTIDARTGVLSFVNAPNFEVPLDANGDNVYQVTVSASDGIAAPVTQALNVSVTDVDESGLSSHVFAGGAVPGAVETGDPTDYELGTRFQANTSGYVTELRYFRGAADAGDTDTRTLTLWTAAGQKLGQATVTSAAGASGWQTATLATAVAIQASTTYVVSYGTTDNYAYTSGWFAAAHPSSDGVLSGANGVFGVGPGNFPTATYNSTSYWVDVTFQQSLPAAPSSAPSIAPITVPTTNEDAAPVQIDLLAGATDPDGDAISVVAPVTVASSNASRSVAYTLSPAGVLAFDPGQFGDLAAGQSETVTVSYKISDGQHAGVANIATVVVEGRDEVGSGLVLTGTSGRDTLTGDAGADTIRGLAGGDQLAGAGGNDTLDGGIGNDSIDGGAGNDTILVIAGEAQGDTITGGAGSDTLKIGGTADLILTTTAAFTELEVFDGSNHALRGTAAADVLDLSGFGTVIGLTGILGLSGNDSLVGSAQADTLDGGANVDTVRGGGGDDTIVIRAAEAQTDVIDGGAGADRILVNASGGDVTIASSNRITGIEQIDGAGVGIMGTSGADTLDFSKMSLVNVARISGLGGADTISGGTGNDILTGGAGNDTFVYHFGDTTGADRITDFDASGNDVIRLDGYSASAPLASAVSFDAQGALIDLDIIGGHGEIRLAGVTALAFTTEDFIFA